MDLNNNHFARCLEDLKYSSLFKDLLNLFALARKDGEELDDDKLLLDS